MWLARYFSNLPTSRLILWSYVIWWLVMVVIYFSPDPRIWSTSLGIGLIVGFALMLCTGPVNLVRFRNRFWESMRLFICPFMVSSFSALVADQNFILVFSAVGAENAIALAGIAALVILARMSSFANPRGER